MKSLDLGCGPRSKLAGSVGLDMRPAPHVDIVHDLNDYPLPFADDEFDHVEMSHVIEHVTRPLDLMAEVHRIARDGATVRVITPHYSSQLSYGDLEHFHHLGYITFLTLQGTGLFAIARHKLWFTDLYRWCGLAWLANRFPRRWEKYHAFTMPALYVEVILRVAKPGGRASADLVRDYMY
ncbi:MAG: methyltransferase domain-containing protein [bacterium]|nr:methyltransferase domain-containing protein [bacterium]